MAAAVAISVTAELEAVEPAIDDAVRMLQERLNALPPAELLAVVEGAARALAQPTAPAPAVAALLTGDRHFSTVERAAAEVEILQRSFARRRALLDGALSTAQVATLLGTSRQTPHDRVASGTLLAVMERGARRFPPWQFDPDGDDGVVTGLPAVLRALDVPPMAKVSWLTRVNPLLDRQTPLACLKQGQVERVVALARAVGVD